MVICWEYREVSMRCLSVIPVLYVLVITLKSWFAKCYIVWLNKIHCFGMTVQLL